MPDVPAPSSSAETARLQSRVLELEQLQAAAESRECALLEAMPIPIVIVRRADHRIVFANSRLEDVFGVSPEHAMGRDTQTFYANPDDRQRLKALLDQHGYVRDFVVPARGVNTPVHTISLSIQAITYQNEPCVLAGIVDLTQYTESEQSLRNEHRLLLRLLELHERDRQLIGFEIHDGIVQEMAATVMFLETAADETEELGETVSENLLNGIRQLRSCINEARRLISGLQPPILDEAGIVPAIENLINEVRERNQVMIEWEPKIPLQRLAPAVEMATFRIVQEGLNNIWQHSQAKTAQVAVTQTGDAITISIRDQGVGFDPSRVKKKRYGLVGIRERARLLGGQAEITSTPGSGTNILVTLPLNHVQLSS